MEMREKSNQVAPQESLTLNSLSPVFRQQLANWDCMGPHDQTPMERDLEHLARQAIMRMEMLERTIETLRNESTQNLKMKELEAVLAETRLEAKLIQTERNTLIEVVRVLASQGEVNPCLEEAIGQEMSCHE